MTSDLDRTARDVAQRLRLIAKVLELGADLDSPTIIRAAATSLGEVHGELLAAFPAEPVQAEQTAQARPTPQPRPVNVEQKIADDFEQAFAAAAAEQRVSPLNIHVAWRGAR